MKSKLRDAPIILNITKKRIEEGPSAFVLHVNNLKHLIGAAFKTTASFISHRNTDAIYILMLRPPPLLSLPTANTQMMEVLSFPRTHCIYTQGKGGGRGGEIII